MGEENRSGFTEKAFGGVPDAIAESLNAWINDSVRIYIPAILNRAEKEIKSYFSNSMKPKPKFEKAIRELAEVSFSRGHENALCAMIEALKKNEYSDQQILKIIEEAERIERSWGQVEQK